ncbi:helix-turn-helix domain-containing protein [Lacicoccus alkaliphilus]|uniref:Transcriptional regulator, XRE family with cupin sensor n=1 Tax=Lacicoccus alkaliphilus DSM 16010 TaxID=1123231 RepID=A0A1M7JZ09_9BACL|nr:XRE family transcriptional regulator [Salinicoccus alkaliphilus]SHM57767.1 transcriptional regulator, XRE family with cupin sensor [Salinicoccus alkaliphilus DSM 16010]
MKEVSEQIKAFRLQQGKTLKKLSEDTGLSVSFLSQVERGESSLAITSLNKIAEALDIHIKTFFEPEHAHDFKIVPSEIVPFKLEKSDQELLRVSSDFENRRLDSYIVKVPPKSQSEPSSHEGEEMYYVIEGEAKFYIDEKEYTLLKGEMIHYPSTYKHYYKNNSQEDLMILCVLTPKLF